VNHKWNSGNNRSFFGLRARFLRVKIAEFGIGRWGEQIDIFLLDMSGLQITSIGYALFVLYGIASHHWSYVVFNLLYLPFSIFRGKNSEEENEMS